MSRIGKQPIEIPQKTTVTVKDGVVTVVGPLGQLSRAVRSDISVTVDKSQVVVKPTADTALGAALWGTYASHISNMVRGVNEPFEKKLVIEGVGYRAEVSGNKLTLIVGFSHPVQLDIPEGLSVTVLKNVISIKGSSKEEVGQFAAKTRAVKKPEPYKGKGIRYEGEVVRRKQGKKAVT